MQPRRSKPLLSAVLGLALLAAGAARAGDDSAVKRLFESRFPGVLPCLAMCALGLCAHRLMGGKQKPTEPAPPAPDR
jgi:hypothetical protein